MYRHIRTPFKRPEQIATHSEGIVHHDADSLFSGHLNDRLIIRNIECRIAEVLQENGLRPAVRQCFNVACLVTFRKAHLDSHVAQSDCEHSECASVEKRLCDNVVSGTAYVRYGEEHGRLSGSGSHSCRSAFKGRHSFFEHLICGIGDAGIYVAGALQFKQFSSILHVIESVCGALVNRDSCSFGNRVNLLSCPDLQGLESVFLFFHIVKMFCLASRWPVTQCLPFGP